MTASTQSASSNEVNQNQPPVHKHRDCEGEKEVYDRCFRNWYRYAYLHKEFEDSCAGYFQEYNSCLKKSLETKGLHPLLDPEHEQWKSMSSLEEIRKERAAKYAAHMTQAPNSDPVPRTRSRSPRKPIISETSELRIMSWNIDGLDSESEEEDMLGRTLWVVRQINELRPHVVVLQELIDFNFQLISSVLKSSFHIFKQELPRQPYFVGILVHKATVDVIGRPVTIPFPTSKMGRAALAVDVKLKTSTHVVTCMTAHLESLKESSPERIYQLKLCQDHIAKHKHDIAACIVGGDLNIRDAEVPPAWKTRDCWNLSGSPKDAEYTWDLLRNDNARMPNGSRPRCRFDRMYLLSEKKDLISVSKFALTGVTRVEGLGRFASDHFGLFTTFGLVG